MQQKATITRLIENAEAGSPNAQFTMALYYKNGTELDLDMDKAIEWATKSAAQDYPHALFFLYNCYLKGEGVAQNEETALEYLKKSAQHGYLDAKKELGL